MLAVERKLITGIIKRQAELENVLIRWCACSSGSHYPVGLAAMSKLLKDAFSVFDVPIQEIPISEGKILKLKKHPTAPIQILLGGHYDTVFPPESSFKSCTKLGSDILQGPGVADMKGGLLVMLYALMALEESPWAGQLGWEVLLNPDEEIGSPESKRYWEEVATRAQAALLFEPTLPDGSLVSTRKGSINLVITSRGKSAHAGRAIDQGCNAITPLLKLLLAIERLHSQEISVNIGHIEGGKAHNIVPEQASAKVNIRMIDATSLELVQSELKRLLEEHQAQEQAVLEMRETSFRPPKEWSEQLDVLFQRVYACGQELDLHLQMQPSGGVCDGNFIAAQGVPVLDTMGVVGCHLHTEEEYMELQSLTTRTALTALFLTRLAREKDAFLPFIANFRREYSSHG